MAYVDQPERFTSSKKIGSYFGLVPSQDQSGGTNRMGRITRQGPSVVRRLVVEASWSARRYSLSVRRYFERVMRNDKERRKKALIATGHYLLRVMLAMLQTGSVWEERLAIDQTKT